MNTPPDRDDEFESTLRARRRFVPRFDNDDDAEPSPELDRIVISRARDALRLPGASAPAPDGTPGGTPARRDLRERHYRGPRWAVPLALAATVMLSFVLVMQLDPARNAAVLAPRATASAPASANEAALAEAARSDTETTDAAAQLGASDAATPAASSPSPGSPSPQTEAEPSSRAAAAPPPAPAPAPMAELVQAPPAIMSAPVAQSAAAAAATAPAEAADFAAGEAAAIAAPAPPPPRAAARLGSAAATNDARAAKAQDTPERAQPTTSTAVDDEDPQAWLVRIERLRDAGEIDAARAQLAEFRRRHPDVSLPPALRELR